MLVKRSLESLVLNLFSLVLVLRLKRNMVEIEKVLTL